MNKQTQLDKGTPEQVSNILASYLHNGKRLRLFYGDQDTGRDWGEEHDTVGYIGRSTGEKPIYILLPNARSIGGGGILTARIVKIVDVKSKRTLYQNPKYHAGTFAIIPTPEGERIGNTDLRREGYIAQVMKDGSNVANFKTEARAQKYVDFMRGLRMAQ